MKDKYKRKAERKQQSQVIASSQTTENHQDETKRLDIPTVSKSMTSQLKTEDSQQFQYAPPRWKTIIEVAAILFGIGYAIVTGLQWWDLRQNFKLDQRPWIGLSDEALVLNSEKVDAELKFTNSGKTPARNVRKAVQIKIAPAPLMESPAEDDIRSLVFSGNTVLAPQATVTVRSGTETEGDQKALILKDAMKSHFPLIDSGKDILYLFGEIIYDDTLGRQRTTKYCLHAVKLERGWHLAECNEFNEMN